MNLQHTVTWVMPISADHRADTDPDHRRSMAINAAQQALDIMRDPEGIATVFHVDAPGGHRYMVDLNADGSLADVEWLTAP